MRPGVGKRRVLTVCNKGDMGFWHSLISGRTHEGDLRREASQSPVRAGREAIGSLSKLGDLHRGASQAGEPQPGTTSSVHRVRPEAEAGSASG